MKKQTQIRRLILSALPLAKFVDELKSRPGYQYVKARRAGNYIIISCPFRSRFDQKKLEEDLREAAKASGLTRHERCGVKAFLEFQDWTATIDPENGCNPPASL